MDALDLQVLRIAQQWQLDAHPTWLVSVVATWGSAPRPIGSLLAVRGDGQLEGSVSGGCIEDDLVRRVRAGECPDQAQLIRYGINQEEAYRFGLPCGGELQLLVEPLIDCDWLVQVLAATDRGELIARQVKLSNGKVKLLPAQRGDRPILNTTSFTQIFGPQWRLLLIGGGQLSRVVAQMAQLLGFQIMVCEPREEYRHGLSNMGVTCIDAMPDDAVTAIRTDAHTAILALTHDPKLDDMALLEALKSPAFYVGALGSRRNSAARRQRLALFDLSEAEIARLHGPVGLHIGSRIPAEIAVSILAQIIAVRSGVANDLVNSAPTVQCNAPPLEGSSCG